MNPDYSSVRSLVVRGEGLFPFCCFGAVKIEWDGIGDYLMSLEEWDSR